MAAKKIKIRLNRVYRGKKTSEQPIQPGIYEDGDDALLGVEASYLVGIGVANEVEDTSEKSSSKASGKAEPKEDGESDNKKTSK